MSNANKYPLGLSNKEFQTQMFTVTIQEHKVYGRDRVTGESVHKYSKTIVKYPTDTFYRDAYEGYVTNSQRELILRHIKNRIEEDKCKFVPGDKVDIVVQWWRYAYDTYKDKGCWVFAGYKAVDSSVRGRYPCGGYHAWLYGVRGSISKVF